MLRCIFITELCIVLWKRLHCCVFLACCHLSLDICSKVLWEIQVQVCAFEALGLFLFQYSVFQNERPTLGANHRRSSISSIKPSITSPMGGDATCWNQTVKLKTVNQFFFFLIFQAKLPYGKLLLWQKCLWQRCLEWRCIEVGFVLPVGGRGKVKRICLVDWFLKAKEKFAVRTFQIDFEGG